MDKVQTEGQATERNTTRRAAGRVVMLVLLATAAALARPARTHGEAGLLLARFQDGATSHFGGLGQYEVEETMTSLAAPSGAARVRLYTPRGREDAPGVVLVHGIHRLSIDEPRLVRFARAIAAVGLPVLTPEVRELAEYHVDATSIETIGRAADMLRARTKGAFPPGVIGTSFAGGLALLAACDPRFEAQIGFVVAIGAHDDLARITRFFATNRIARPDGSVLELRAHEYGTIVFIESHAGEFFPPEDVDVAEKALRAWLWEERDEARALAASLSAPSRARIEDLFQGHVEAFAPEILADAESAAAAMARVSPHGKLGALRVPVFLLHGNDDTVIPPSETLWLAHEVPPELLKAAVISRAVGHVELQGAPSLYEQWVLLHFMAQVLDTATLRSPRWGTRAP